MLVETAVDRSNAPTIEHAGLLGHRVTLGVLSRDESPGEAGHHPAILQQPTTCLQRSCILRHARQVESLSLADPDAPNTLACGRSQDLRHDRRDSPECSSLNLRRKEVAAPGNETKAASHAVYRSSIGLNEGDIHSFFIQP